MGGETRRKFDEDFQDSPGESYAHLYEGCTQMQLERHAGRSCWLSGTWPRIPRQYDGDSP
jgi:hypothetical protein